MSVMRIIELNDGTPTAYDGQYLLEYDPTRSGVDPNGRPMNCHLVTTPDPDKALNLPAGELLEIWKQSHGVRPDGKPNRQLSAFTVEIS